METASGVKDLSIVSVFERHDEFLKIKIAKGHVRDVVRGGDDPAIAINIYHNNLQRGLNEVNGLSSFNRPPIPLWAPAAFSYPLNADMIVSGVLEVVAAVTNGGIVDNFCICPNTAVEAMGISQRFGELNVDPFIVALAGAAQGPLARIHAFFERKTVQTSVNVALPRPLALGVNQIQAFI